MKYDILEIRIQRIEPSDPQHMRCSYKVFVAWQSNDAGSWRVTFDRVSAQPTPTDFESVMKFGMSLDHRDAVKMFPDLPPRNVED